jgi:hypothetical protein
MRQRPIFYKNPIATEKLNNKKETSDNRLIITIIRQFLNRFLIMGKISLTFTKKARGKNAKYDFYCLNPNVGN